VGKAIGWFMLSGLGFLIGLLFWVAIFSGTKNEVGMPWLVIIAVIAFAALIGGAGAWNRGVKAWQDRDD
jgi:hypothetical protein